MISRTAKAWYPIRITYSREIALKEHLESIGIKCYIPMHYQTVGRDEHKKRKLVPIIHNLVFVYSTREQLDSLKKELEYRLPMRYIMERETRQPIIVPDKQMQDFITVADTYNEQVIYLDPGELKLKKGSRVRITEGIFCGVEGKLLRIKGDRRVVVSIEGIMAVATTFIHPSMLEVIPD